MEIIELGENYKAVMEQNIVKLKVNNKI